MTGPAPGTQCFRIREFDCHEPSIDAPAGDRSRHVAFRYAPVPDSLGVAFECSCAELPPIYTLARIAPGSQTALAAGQLPMPSRTVGAESVVVATVLDLAVTGPPPLADGVSTVQSLTDALVNGLIPPGAMQLRPFEGREEYQLTLMCNCAGCHCSAAYNFSVFDGDVAVLCYKVDQAQARYELSGLVPDVLPARTLREFLAFFGETGADRLFERYAKGGAAEASGGARRFEDPAAMGTLSAVLAEETYDAFVNAERGNPLWAKFFRIRDRLIPPGGLTLWWWIYLWDASKAFGQAHTRLGVATALAKRDSRCLANDLEGIVEELTDANRHNAQALLQRHPFARRRIGPVDRFQSSLRKAILQALLDTGRTTVYAELRQRW